MIDVRQTLDALAGIVADLRLLVSRVDDDAFEIEIVMADRLAKAPTLDLAQTRGAMRWARDRGIPISVTFVRWPPWFVLGVEPRAHEVLRVCEAKPTRVIVSVSALATEGGGVALKLDMQLPGDAHVETMLDMTYTSRDTHADIEAGFVKRGTNLAAVLGVPLSS